MVGMNRGKWLEREVVRMERLRDVEVPGHNFYTCPCAVCRKFQRHMVYVLKRYANG